MDNNYLLPIINFEPAVMARGEGSYLYDTEGKKYLDLNSGQFCTVLGHGNSEILENVKSSMDRLSHTASNILADEVLRCASKIHELSGEMRAYSILLSTGAESVEFALRYSKHIRGRDGIICFSKGYHGLTLGTQSVTFGGKFACPAVSDVYSVDVPDFTSADEASYDETSVGKASGNGTSRKSEAEYIDAFRELVKRVHNRVSAVLMEPVVSVGGMLFPSASYFQAVRQICDEYELLLIFDESQTGFGRLGSWFAYQQLGMTPDIVCLSKGVGLGFPVSMVLFKDKLVGKEPFRMTHYSSHQNDAFAASVVNAGISYIEKHDILQKVRHTGAYFLKALTDLCAGNPHIQSPRGNGLMLGADLYFDGVTDYRNIYHHIYDEMMKNGIIIQGTSGGRVLRFLPDYLISEKDIDFAADTLDFVLSSKNWAEDAEEV